MITIENARDSILANIVPITDTIRIPFDSTGYICAEDIFAMHDVPEYPRSAMDGYAVRSTDIAGASPENPVCLEVIDEVFAGDNACITYMEKSAVRIMTGGMIPDGYDCVVMQEDTDYGEDNVHIYRELKPYTNYCMAGENIRKDSLVIPKGRKIGRIEVSLLASLGIEYIYAIRPADIGIISTGSELVEVGTPLLKGQIYNSILKMLKVSIEDRKLHCSYEKNCLDEADVIAENIERALECSDMIITTGGISVGKRDLISNVLERMGAKKLFAGADIQPGTPTMGSVINGKIILSLSGNPYAAIANFDYYFPYIAAELMGSDSYLPVVREAPLADPYDKINKRRRFIRAEYRDGKVYLPEGGHYSSVVSNLVNCNCYIDMPAGRQVSTGDMVVVRSFFS